MTPSVTVVIPTYNRAALVVSAVASVLGQDDPGCELEVIVVDDGSTDGTFERLRDEFGDAVVYRRIPNSGRPAVARNVGLRLARGELVAFNDSDDVWLPHKLRRQLPALEGGDTVLVYSNAEVVSPAGEPSGATVIRPEQARSGCVFADLLRENFVPHLTVVARRDALLAVGGFDESPRLRGMEDFELWLRLAVRGRFRYVDDVVALYRRHDGNLSDVSLLDNIRQQHAVCRSVLASGLDAQPRALAEARARELVRERLPLIAAESTRAGAGRVAEGAAAAYALAGRALVELAEPEAAELFFTLVRAAGLAPPALPLDVVGLVEPGVGAADAFVRQCAELASAGLLGRAAVGARPACVDRLAAELEAALAQAPRVELDLVPVDSIEPLLASGRVALAEPASADAAAAEAHGIPVLPYACDARAA